MSYLDGPRITFTGRFFGDVSTVNNDRASFQPSPQPPNPPPGRNWNPGGSATFDFLNCRVVGSEGASGAPMSVDDPARGLAIVGAADRSSAKLVDLDPDWQRSSQLWGLAVRLVDPATGEELLSGSFRVAAFRDLWARQFQRWRPNGPESGGAFVTLNGQPSGGSYTSVLDDVVYGPGVASSPVLSALQRAATTPRLSIVLNLFGYFTGHVDGRFATGSLTGCIGPWRPGEPDTFVAGRRIEMGVVRQASPASASTPPDQARLLRRLGGVTRSGGVPAGSRPRQRLSDRQPCWGAVLPRRALLGGGDRDRPAGRPAGLRSDPGQP
jgi:hypothetical protein